MRIDVNDYQGFKDVCTEMSGASGPAHVFYSVTISTGTVSQILAIFTGGFYLYYSANSVPVLPAALIVDFPLAIHCGELVQGVY